MTVSEDLPLITSLCKMVAEWLNDTFLSTFSEIFNQSLILLNHKKFPTNSRIFRKFRQIFRRVAKASPAPQPLCPCLQSSTCYGFNVIVFLHSADNNLCNQLMQKPR